MDTIIFKIYEIKKINKEYRGGCEFQNIDTLICNEKLLKNKTYVCFGEIKDGYFKASKTFEYKSIEGKILSIKYLTENQKELIIDINSKKIKAYTNCFKTEKNIKTIFKGYIENNYFHILNLYPIQTLNVIIKEIPKRTAFNYALKECKVEIKDNLFNSVKFNKFKIKGVLELIYQNDEIEITGYFEENKYGTCFNVISHSKNISSGTKLLKSYLNKQFPPSNKIIGKKRIDEIVEIFGLDTLKVIENYPEKIQEHFPKMKEENIEKFRDRVIMSQFIQELYFFCDRENIDARIADKIYDKYGLASIKALKENPYELVSIDSSLFMQADILAKDNNISYNNLQRIKSGIKYFIEYDSKTNGNVYTDIQYLYENINNFIYTIGSFDKNLNINKKEIDKALQELVADTIILIDNEKIYLRYNYIYETFIANKIKELINDFKIPFTTENKIEETITDFSKKFKLAKNQKNAVKNALLNNISILTGGPGTGKTLTVRAIIHSIKTINPNAKFKLAAPTGRASQRLSEVTMEPATTIHKLLNINSYQMVDLNPEKPSNMENLDFLIIDEFSMVDIELFFKLLKCLDEKTRLIIVGDYNQLPSVNAGQILKDLIDSKKIPTTKLKEVFRQGKDSLIIEVAHAINNKEQISFEKLISNKKNFLEQDFSFIEAKTINKIDEITSEIITTLINNGKTFKDIQILCSTNKGESGTIKINEDIQKNFNKSTIYQEINSISKFKENDKVIQTINNYDLKVMNGSIGFINKILEVKGETNIVVEYEDIEVTYDLKTLEEIKLAYAITTHKSQGSEFSITIIPIHKNQLSVLNLNLLYTAITRAKSNIIMIGDLDIFKEAIEKSAINRNSGLIERL